MCADRRDPAPAALVTVQVDGRAVAVPAGASVVAALAAADQLCTRLSVTGEPRFALCGMGQCQECRVTIDGRPHRLACQTRCRDGMVVITGEGRAGADVAAIAADGELAANAAGTGRAAGELAAVAAGTGRAAGEIAAIAAGTGRAAGEIAAIAVDSGRAAGDLAQVAAGDRRRNGARAASAPDDGGAA